MISNNNIHSFSSYFSFMAWPEIWTVLISTSMLITFTMTSFSEFVLLKITYFHFISFNWSFGSMFFDIKNFNFFELSGWSPKEKSDFLDGFHSLLISPLFFSSCSSLILLCFWWEKLTSWSLATLLRQQIICLLSNGALFKRLQNLIADS